MPVAGPTGGAYPRFMANVLDYVEFAVDDLQQAKAFYTKALGWTFTDYGGEYAGIQDPRNPGQEVGGLNPRRDARVSRWTAVHLRRPMGKHPRRLSAARIDGTTLTRLTSRCSNCDNCSVIIDA